jgi:hypothetical protein
VKDKLVGRIRDFSPHFIMYHSLDTFSFTYLVFHVFYVEIVPNYTSNKSKLNISLMLLVLPNLTVNIYLKLTSNS